MSTKQLPYLNRNGYLLKVEDLGPDQVTSCKTFRLQAWQFGTKVEEQTNVVCK